MRYLFLLLQLLPVSVAAAQLAPTARTFLGNGRAPNDPIFNVPGAAGSDISRYPIRPEGISVDQAGNLTVGISYVIRVTKNARFLYAQASLGSAAYTVATAPLGLVAGAESGRCFMTASQQVQSGPFGVRTIGNCLEDPQDAGDGGPLNNVRFLSVSGIGVDRLGDVYIYDSDASKIRRLGADGVMRTVVSGIRLRTGVSSVAVLLPAHPQGGIVGIDANTETPIRIHSQGTERFSIPDFSPSSPFTWDLDDNLYYFRGSDGSLIRRTPSGIVTVIGLNGRFEFTEGINASDLSLPNADGIAADTSGNVYVFSRVTGRNIANNPLDFRVLRIQLPGVGRPDCSFSVSSNPIPASGGSVSLSVTASAASCYWSASSSEAWLRVASTTLRGSGTIQTTVSANTGADRTASLIIAGQSYTITQLASSALASNPSGIISTFAGAPGQSVFTPLRDAVPGANFRLGFVGEMKFDSKGDLFVADSGRYQILRFSKANGTVSAVAGIGGLQTTPNGFGGLATNARLSGPFALAIDASDNIYSSSNRTVVRFRVGGNLEHIADGRASITFPSAAFDSFRQRMLFTFGDLYSLGASSLIPLSSTTTFSYVENSPIQNNFIYASSVLADPSGNVYVSEATGRRVLRISPDGIVTRFAGSGSMGSSGDNGPASSAQLSLPTGLAMDRAGNLYIADGIANRVRRVRPDGIIETAVGNGIQATTGNGGAANAASIYSPSTLAFDSEGNLYIGCADSTIRKVTFPRPASGISAGGVINLSGGVVSPGALFSIYGTNLASATVSAPAFPLPTALAGVSVLVNGGPVPLTYVSPNQINAQFPYSIAPGRATVSVRNSSGTTDPASIEVFAAGPAILEYGVRRAVATSTNAALNTDNSPAAPGDAVIVYLTGIGPVDPPAIEGASASSSVLARATLPATVSVGNIPAELLFLGLAPGFAGLAQANLIVPSLPNGLHAIEFTIGGRKSNLASIAVRNSQ